jgi:hypothetical protein
VRMRILAVVVIMLGVAGCTFNDPTEDTGPMTLRNHLSHPIRVGYCADEVCHKLSWTDDLPIGGSSSDSVVGDGSRQTFVVDYGRVHRCISVLLTRARLHAGLDVRERALRVCPTGG